MAVWTERGLISPLNIFRFLSIQFYYLLPQRNLVAIVIYMDGQLVILYLHGLGILLFIWVGAAAFTTFNKYFFN